MNKFNNYTGGLPLKTDEIIRIKEDLDNFKIQVLNTKPQILWGCHWTGADTIGEGVIIDPISGEYFYHPATKYGGFTVFWYASYTDVPSNQRVYGDANTNYVWNVRRATFVQYATASTWTGANSEYYTNMDGNRLDDKFYHLLNNEIFISNSDIDTTGDLRLNHTELSDIIIGATSSQMTTINTKLDHINNDTALYFINSYPTTISYTNYDRIIYSHMENSVGNVHLSIDGDTIAYLTTYGSSCIILPAGKSLVYNASSTPPVYIKIDKFGK